MDENAGDADGLISIVVVSDDEVDLRALAEVEGLEPVDAPQVAVLFDPVTAAVVAGGAVLVGRFIVRAFTVLRGGVQVTLGNPPSIKRNRAIPHDYVFVFTASGDKVEINKTEELEDSLERMFTKLVKLPITATVDVVKATIDAARKGAATDPAAGGTTPADPA